MCQVLGFPFPFHPASTYRKKMLKKRKRGMRRRARGICWSPKMKRRKVDNSLEYVETMFCRKCVSTKRWSGSPQTPSCLPCRVKGGPRVKGVTWGLRMGNRFNRREGWIQQHNEGLDCKPWFRPQVCWCFLFFSLRWAKSHFVLKERSYFLFRYIFRHPLGSLYD